MSDRVTCVKGTEKCLQSYIFLRTLKKATCCQQFPFYRKLEKDEKDQYLKGNNKTKINTKKNPLPHQHNFQSICDGTLSARKSSVIYMKLQIPRYKYSNTGLHIISTLTYSV